MINHIVRFIKNRLIVDMVKSVCCYNDACSRPKQIYEVKIQVINLWKDASRSEMV